MRRWPRTAPTAAGPQPSHSSERCGPPRPCRTSVSTTRSTHLPQCSGGHHAEDLVPASVGQLHRGEWKLHLPSIPGRGCSINRSLVAMNRYSGCSWSALSSWARSSHQPTADPCPHDAPQPCGTASASLARRPRTPHGGTPSSRPTPTANSITPNRSSPPSAQYRSNSRWYPAVSDLSITFSTPAGRRPSASINTRNC